MSKYLFFSIFFFNISGVYCQDDNESLKTQQITIFKSYTPELTSVNKIRSLISVNDMIKSDKVTVTYFLIDIPVISTFKPNKVSPLNRKKNYSDESNYNSHFDFGLGSAGQLILDFSNHITVDRSQSVGVDILNTNYGSLNSTKISSDESQFIFGLDHVFSSQKMEMVHKVFLNQHKSNYYGIYENSSVLSDPLILDKINSSQERNSLQVLSNWKFYDSFFKEASLSVRVLNDSYGSKEEVVKIKTDIFIPIFRMNLLVVPKLIYVNSFFKEDYFERKSIKSLYTKFETVIQLSNIENKLKYQIGSVITYLLSQSEKATPNILISPKIMLSYGLNSSKFLPYLTLDGGIDLISYSDISDLNPYVSPTLNLIPTQNIYNGRIGIKSSFDMGFDLNFGAHYKKQLNSFLFKRQAYDSSIVSQGFRLANSYGLEYDNISQYGFFGETSINFGKENILKVSMFQYVYDTDKISHPWNLPDFEGRLTLDIKIVDKLRISMSAKYLGERPTAYRQVFLNQTSEKSPTELKFLPPLSQVKAEINYRFDSKWQSYLRTQYNIGSIKSKWDYYLLNQNLFLGGIRYSFDLAF